MWGWFDKDRIAYFNEGGGGNEAKVAADQAESNARLSRLQSQTMGMNIDFMSGQLVNNLKRFDEISRTTQGSTALALARSGGMTSRRTSSMLSSEQLGIEYDAIDAVEYLQQSMAETSDQLREQRSTVDGFNTQILSIDSQMQELIGTKEEEYTETETRRVRDAEFGWTTESKKVTKTRTVEYIIDEDKYNELSQQKAQIIDEKDAYIESLERTDEELQEEIDWLDGQIDTMGDVQESVIAEAGGGTVDLQQLSFAKGSTIATISRGLENIKDQRDQMFSEGMTGILSMVQQQAAAEEQAQISMEQADQYMELSRQMEAAQNMNLLFQGLGLIGGLALSPVMGPGAGLAVGGAAGSFLGNVFASRV